MQPLLVLVIFISACSPELMPARTGLKYTFLPDTGLSYDLQTKADSLHVFIKITNKTTIGNLQKPGATVPYFLSRDYTRNSIYLRDSVLAVDKNLKNLLQDAAMIDFTIPISKITYPSVITLRLPQFSATQEETLLDIPLTTATKNQNFLLLDSTGQYPLFQTYINNQQTFYIQASRPDTLVTARQFPLTVTPAIPPMSRKNAATAPTLKAQSKPTFPANEPVQLAAPGIYLLETQSGCRSLLVEEGSYPALTSAAELIEPLIYLTSSAERKNLYDAPNPKLAVDAFWLGIARQDQNLGKSLIREYYGRVEKANRYFAAHKAGWLTDRGMIYLVFGTPAYITRDWDREEWIYPQYDGPNAEVKFIFIKKPNTFTQNHYELVRDAAYEFAWYNQVDQWRKGTIGMIMPDAAPSGRRNRRR
ncbi:GWxTD domain-containing protein [Adhaeribacter swui]|uniref:GWxTD domain-containing protein n=1 Tax=Adhaeribacter swui TaxID=2086471 RepID=A0A7G7G571_9BACT|nr:GWxTD domain-containing protein [Adhaeribacter swui]QNF32305.1 GWxTD domain-containing protein [Adhaeribacter swui]